MTEARATRIVNKIVIRARETASGGISAPDDLVLAQYAGVKAALRPIYDDVIAAVRGFGNDVEVAPKKGYVSLRRSKQFAIVQPSTASRLDIGLNLKGVAPSGRLEASGSFNAKWTHRVRIDGKAGLDSSVKKWLKQAYDAAWAGRHTCEDTRCRKGTSGRIIPGVA